MYPSEYLTLLHDAAPVCAVFRPGEASAIRLDNGGGVPAHPLDVLPTEAIDGAHAVVVITTGRAVDLTSGDEYAIRVGVCITPDGAASLLSGDGKVTITDEDPQGEIADRMRLILGQAA